MSSVGEHPQADSRAVEEQLLLDWCTALAELQLGESPSPQLAGGIACPACARVHARSWEAAYPLLSAARHSGEERFLAAALRAYERGEDTSLYNGAWHDDPSPELWTGTTVFGALTLGQALLHHADLLPAAAISRWRERLRAAVGFLLAWPGLERANGNYRATAACALDLAGRVLDDEQLAPRAAQLAASALAARTFAASTTSGSASAGGAHAGNTLAGSALAGKTLAGNTLAGSAFAGKTLAGSALAGKTFAASAPSGGLLTGEGRHRRAAWETSCEAIDIAYNVEESLPALALYAMRADPRTLAPVVALLRDQLPFSLPDGGWDEGWCTRSYKWTYWGTRTGSGCQPAYGLLAGADPRFGAVARANLELLRRCTHDGLLHGGPHYRAHAIDPCVHHTVFHARALATVLDQPPAPDPPVCAMAPTDRGAPLHDHTERPFHTHRGTPLPDAPSDPLATDPSTSFETEPDGVREVPGTRTWILRRGPWRATLSAYDCAYSAQPMGGALVLLWHDATGPLVAAGPLEDRMIEPHNMQIDRARPYATPTPGIELASEGATFRSAACAQPQITVEETDCSWLLRAAGQLVTADQQGPGGRTAPCEVSHSFDEDTVTITARVAPEVLPLHPLLVLPLIATPTARVAVTDGEVSIEPDGGAVRLELHARPAGALCTPTRGFALVPGFGTVRIALDLTAGEGLGELELRVARR